MIDWARAVSRIPEHLTLSCEMSWATQRWCWGYSCSRCVGSGCSWPNGRDRCDTYYCWGCCWGGCWWGGPARCPCCRWGGLTRCCCCWSGPICYCWHKVMTPSIEPSMHTNGAFQEGPIYQSVLIEYVDHVAYRQWQRDVYIFYV